MRTTVVVFAALLLPTAAAAQVGPVADAGPDQAAVVGASVQLDGSGSSDPDGFPLTFSWTFTTVPFGSTPELNSSTIMNPVFVADVAGTYEVQLIVSNGAENSAPDTVTITATLPGSAGTWLYTVSPCRLVDTRDAAGPLGGPALASGAPRGFAFDGECGIPASATAVVVNLTVTGATSAGHLTVWAGGGQAPETSVVNFAGGQTRANNAVLPVSGAAALTAMAFVAGNGSVHLIVDVNGYFD